MLAPIISKRAEASPPAKFSVIYFGNSLEASRCLVGASAPRCRVVPSVTLGGGSGTGPVFRPGNDSMRGAAGIEAVLTLPLISVRLSCSLMRMNCAMPLPIIENAGIIIQNHHPWPILENDRASATKRKPSPMKACRMADSRVPLPCLFRSRLSQRVRSSSLASGNCPVKACGTRLMLAPHTRQ